MFSGVVFCADCGKKMYYSATNNYKHQQANFFCSSFRKDTDTCSMHYIREKVIYDLVLEDMKRVFFFVTAYEKEFAQMQLDNFSIEKGKNYLQENENFKNQKSVSRKLIH